MPNISFWIHRYDITPFLKDSDEDDEISSIEDNSPKQDAPEKKEKKKVTIQEDEDGKPVAESEATPENQKSKKKKSKACTIL